MTRFATLARALLLTLPVLLNACGGGGGGGSPATYTLGGAITGLTTSGLILVNGSDTVSPAAAATTFTFGTAVVSGATYSVSVQTQPTNATCTVSAGSGSMPAAAVTSVQVSCNPNTFQVGGTISGLSAAGLVLANGSDTVSSASGATSFVFSKRVTVGISYAVTVTSQPTGLSCTVTSGAGTANADVNNVAVSCKPVPVAGWSTPTTVGTGVFPILANDPSSVAFFLAWCSCTGAVTSGTASRYTDAGGWTTPVAITSAQAGTTLTGMQFDAQGRGFATWNAPTGMIDGSVNPMYSRYLPGTGWVYFPMPYAVQLPPLILPQNSVLYSSVPTLGVSVGSDGTAVAAVQENTYVHDGLGNVSTEFLTTALAGAAPGSDVLQIGAPDALIPSSDGNPSMIVDGNGKTVTYFPRQVVPFAMTPSSVPGQYAIFYRVFDTVSTTLSDGSPGADRITTTGLAMHTGSVLGATIALQVEDLLAENPLGRGVSLIGVSKASVAIAANGDALATWSSIKDDLTSSVVFAQRFVGGAWQARQVVYSISGDFSSAKMLPVAALDDAGNGMIVFNTLSTLMAAKLTAATGALSAPTQVGPDNGQPLSLLLDARGNAFLLVSGSVRRYDVASGVWGAPAPGIAGGEGGVIALDSAGNPMVAWSSGTSILASRYH